MQILTQKQQLEKKHKELCKLDDFFGRKIADLEFQVDLLERRLFSRRNFTQVVEELRFTIVARENNLDYIDIIGDRISKIK